MLNSLWTERYRPKILDEIILSQKNRDFFESCKKNKSIINILLTGVAGLGKTTIAKIIVKDIIGCDYLYINASDENGIDTVRGKIVTFAQTRSLDGGLKVIICDEFDGFSDSAQRALRNIMEEYSQNTRFVLTANYHHRIIEPIQSRCQHIDLFIDQNQYLDRLRYICTQEKVQITEDALKNLTSQYFPDFRKVINTLQHSHESGVVLSEARANKKLLLNILKHVTKKDPVAVRTEVIHNEREFNNDYPQLLRDMYEFIFETDFSSEKKRMVLLIIAEHLYRSSFVLDQEINCHAAFLNIMDI